MAESKPVVVYGASGYTGRLICEYLREYNVPFVAAGRDKWPLPVAGPYDPDFTERDVREAAIWILKREGRPLPSRPGAPLVAS